jgi:hypothetical protein
MIVKVLAITYALAAITVAVITTILQVQPALLFIEFLTGPDDKFPAMVAMLITALALLLPLVVILFVVGLFTKKGGNKIPDLAGKTGILIRRERVLSNGFYTDKVMINGQKLSTVSNGKSTFVELADGSYKVFVKGATTQSPIMDVALAPGQVVKLKTGYRPENAVKVSQYLETDE